MGHAALAGRRIDVAAMPAALVGGHKHHVQALFDLRKEQPLSTVDPRQRRSVGQQNAGLTTENRHFPFVPSKRTVGNARAIGREDWAQFLRRVMRKLNGLAVRQELDVDLSQPEERIISPDEGEHSAVLRQRGIHGGVGKESELLPFFAQGRTAARRAIEEKGCCNSRQQKKSSRDIIAFSPCVNW